jgi:hypothetical protein
VKANTRPGIRRMAGHNAQDDIQDPGVGLPPVMVRSRGDRIFVPSRKRPARRPPSQQTGGRVQRMVTWGVTLAALIFLAVVLAWPLVVWLLSLAGIKASSFCI